MTPHYYQDARTGALLPTQPILKEQIEKEYFSVFDRWIFFCLLVIACLVIAGVKGLL